MTNNKKFLSKSSIFLIVLSLSIFYLDNTNEINDFNYTDDYNYEKDNNEFQRIQLFTNGPADKYNFKYYKVITINHTKVFGSSDYSNFSLLISIFDSDLLEHVQSDGDDIAFANDTEWLDHEIELFNQEYNSTHAQLIAWVRIPLLSVSINTNITMYYGNPYLNAQENPTGVWDKNYQGIWHMAEVNAIDSTSNNNDGIQDGEVTHFNEGKINGANFFDGNDDYITIGNIGSEIKTIEFWMNPSNLGSDGLTETSWKNPSATGEYYDQWNNSKYAFTSNDSYSIGGPDESQDWYNFDFNIPNGATINGIELKIEASQSNPVEGTVALSWNGGSNYTLYSETKTWDIVGDNNETFGGSIITWGETWSSEELNNSNFRVRLQRSSHSTGTLAVDCIYVKVYYNYEFMRIIDLDGISRIEIVEEKLLTTNFPDTSTIYIDGVNKSSLTTDWHYIAITNTEGINVSALEIGRVSTDYFDGIIDELHVSDILRTPDSFNTSYFNQNDPTSFYNISQEFDFNTDPPVYSNLTESSNRLELGETVIISINITDPSGIRQVKIEFEGVNHSMSNIGGDIWRYDLWTPSQTDNYTYTIYMEDNCGIWNSVSDSIEVVDTTSPTYSNLIESANPLELGNNITISLDVSDLSGINKVLIEFEGSNYSMVNIGGDTWQYDLWTPSYTDNYTYTIYIEDNNNHWNLIMNNITVQDTTPPSPPTMIYAPSGGVNRTLTYDWEEDFDHSGISYYIIIIDNETDPYATPGFIYYINITNTGPNSSYYELDANLLPGTYYYFICQVDGVGLNSDFTEGSFTILPLNNGNNNITFLDILPYILGSIIASVAIIVIARRRIHNKIHPPRKKIPLKVIFSHIKEISTVKSTFEKEEQKNILDDQLTYKTETLDEEELENRLKEIKTLGEELFNEGAYLEAHKQFEIAEDLFLKLDRKDEALFYSKLIANIKNLSEEREVKLENLENEKEKNNFIKIMDIYIDLIQISKKLKDFDTSRMYQFELIQLIKDRNLKISDLEHKRNKLEEQANIYLDQNLFEEATKFYEYCEEISLTLLQLDRVEENYNIDKFRDKINEVLKKIK